MDILALETQALERFYSGDPYGYAEISDGGITAITPDLLKPILGLDPFRAYLKTFEGRTPPQTVKITNPLVQTHGSAAVLSYHYRAAAENTAWNVTSVYFQAGGAWKLVHTHRAYLHHRPPKAVEVPLPLEHPARPYEGVLAELMALEAGAMVRWRKGDPWGFIELYDASATYMDTGTPQRIDGRDALEAEYATRAGKIFYDVSDFIAPQVQVCGDTAVLFYRFFSTTLHPDGSVADRIPWNSTEVYTRIGGAWKIIHNHWSFIRGEPVGDY